MWRIIQTIGNLFWLWTILGTAWAWFVPDHFTWFITGKFPGTDVRLINLGLGVIMLGMGITLSVDDFKAVLLRPWVVGSWRGSAVSDHALVGLDSGYSL